jgi:hypothetical protein
LQHKGIINNLRAKAYLAIPLISNSKLVTTLQDVGTEVVGGTIRGRKERKGKDKMKNNSQWCNITSKQRKSKGKIGTKRINTGVLQGEGVSFSA